MSRGKKLISDVFLFAISNFGSKVLVFLLVPLYTHTLSTEEYGIADLITVTNHLLFPLLTVGITEATLRFSLDEDTPKEKVVSLSLLTVFTSVIILLLLSPLVGLIKPGIKDYLAFFILIYLSSSLNNCFSNFTRGLDKTRIFAIKGILYTILLLSSNILFLIIFKWGINGYLISMIIADSLSVLYMIIAAKEYKYISFSFDLSVLKKMFKYSSPMIPTILAWWIMQVSDKYIIIAFSGIAISGIYSVAYKIQSILSLITTIFNQAWQISAVKTVDDSDYKQYFKKVYSFYFTISLIFSSILILLSEILGKLLFANDYFIAWRYVPLLIIAYFYSGLSGVMASAFTAIKKTLVLLYSTIVGAAFNVAFNFILIPYFGAMAAATTTMVGFLITFIIRDFCLNRICEIKLHTIKDYLIFVLVLGESIISIYDMEVKYLICGCICITLLVLYSATLREILKDIKALFLSKRKKMITQKCANNNSNLE